MNANQGNVTDAAMRQWLPHSRKICRNPGRTATDPSFEKYNAGGQAASESGNVYRPKLRTLEAERASSKIVLHTAAEEKGFIRSIV
jgi:hypothetical protein